jgi:trehalose 6-phosphate phosphatase
MQRLVTDADQRLESVLGSPGPVLLCLDYDGVLAPIVDDPAQAVIHPRARDVLLSVATLVHDIAVVTGRPARQAVGLGRLDELAADLAGRGCSLQVRGQYGAQRWTSAEGVVSAPVPAGLAGLEGELPILLSSAGATTAIVEHKGLALAVHTRRMDDPAGALDRIRAVLQPAAERWGLIAEPGRYVLEFRASGHDKGTAVRELVAELAPAAVVFIGDDLGDIPAFEAVAELRRGGLAGLLVCSASDEEGALLELADIAVAGPDGVMELLAALSRP